jgi:hypothetical protein
MSKDCSLLKSRVKKDQLKMTSMKREVRSTRGPTSSSTEEMTVQEVDRTSVRKTMLSKRSQATWTTMTT